ncbi:hypothetical protein D3Z50_21730 [Clostridiaceae bacterium]|jgi:hypothetical protein|nr:hypothetical protein [Clostridiaceae bacterium]
MEKVNVLCVKDGLEMDTIIELTENEDCVKIKFILGKIIIEKESETYFEALVKLRKDLEKINIKLLCKGCCKNVYPSGMILNMGTGRKAYTLSYGEQARMNSLVDIFTPCSVDQYATVQQQADFFKSWIKSIGKK